MKLRRLVGASAAAFMAVTGGGFDHSGPLAPKVRRIRGGLSGSSPTPGRLVGGSIDVGLLLAPFERVVGRTWGRSSAAIRKFGTKYRFRGAAAHGARAWDLKRPERTHTRFPSPAVGRHCGFRRRRVRMEGALLLRRGYRLVGPAQGLPGLARTKRNGDDPADRPWLLRRLRHCSNPKPSRVVSSLCRAPVAFSA